MTLNQGIHKKHRQVGFIWGIMLCILTLVALISFLKLNYEDFGIKLESDVPVDELDLNDIIDGKIGNEPVVDKLPEKTQEVPKTDKVVEITTNKLPEKTHEQVKPGTKYTPGETISDKLPEKTQEPSKANMDYMGKDSKLPLNPDKDATIFSYAIPTSAHHLIMYIGDRVQIDSILQIKITGKNELYAGMASSFTDLRNEQVTIFHGASMFKGVANTTMFEVTHGENTAIFKYAMYELNGDQTTYTFSNSTYRLLYRLAIHMDNFVGLAIFDTVKTISMDDSFWLAVKQSSAEVANKQFEVDYFSITDATIEIVNYLKSNDSTYQPGNEVILKYWDCYIFGFRLLNKLGIKIETMYKPLVGDIDVHQQVLKSFTSMNISDTTSFSGYPFAIPVNDGYGRLLMDPNGNDLLNKLVSWQNTPVIEATVESDIPILSVPMDAPVWLYHWGVFVMQSYVVYPLY